MGVDLNEIDLDQLSTEELKQVAEKVKTAVASRHQERLIALREQIRATADEMGLSIQEVVFGQRSRKGGAQKTPAQKYRNPADPTQTWAGRGKRPVWLVKALEAGASLESLEIR